MPPGRCSPSICALSEGETQALVAGWTKKTFKIFSILAKYSCNSDNVVLQSWHKRITKAGDRGTSCVSGPGPCGWTNHPRNGFCGISGAFYRFLCFPQREGERAACFAFVCFGKGSVVDLLQFRRAVFVVLPAVPFGNGRCARPVLHRRKIVE